MKNQSFILKTTFLFFIFNIIYNFPIHCQNLNMVLTNPNAGIFGVIPQGGKVKIYCKEGTVYKGALKIPLDSSIIISGFK